MQTENRLTQGSEAKKQSSFCGTSSVTKVRQEGEEDMVWSHTMTTDEQKLTQADGLRWEKERLQLGLMGLETQVETVGYGRKKNWTERAKKLKTNTKSNTKTQNSESWQQNCSLFFYSVHRWQLLWLGAELVWGHLLKNGLLKLRQAKQKQPNAKKSIRRQK